MSDNNILDLPDHLVETTPSSYALHAQSKSNLRGASTPDRHPYRNRSSPYSTVRSIPKASNKNLNSHSSLPSPLPINMENTTEENIEADYSENENENFDDLDMEVASEDISDNDTGLTSSVLAFMRTFTQSVTTELLCINERLNSQNLKLTKRLSNIETLHDTSLQTIRNLEKKIDHLTTSISNTSTTSLNVSSQSEKESTAKTINMSNTTWAQRAANGVLPTTSTTPTCSTFFPKSKRTLLSPQSPSTERLTPTELLTARNTINNTLKECKAPANAFVTTVHQTEKGNLVLQTRGDCLAETVLGFKVQIMKALNKVSDEIKIQEIWSKVIVHNIPLESFPDTSTGMNMLQNEIESCNSKVKLTLPPRYLSRPENRMSKKASSVVITVRSASEANLILQTQLFIHNEQHRTEKYF